MNTQTVHRKHASNQNVLLNQTTAYWYGYVFLILYKCCCDVYAR